MDKDREETTNKRQSVRPRLSNGQNRQIKLGVFMAVSILLLGALAARLIYIVKVHGTEYQKAV